MLKNFNYLNDQVRASGVPGIQEEELWAILEKPAAKNSIVSQVTEKNRVVDAELNFMKSSLSDLVFYDGFRLQIKDLDTGETALIGKDQVNKYKLSYEDAVNLALSGSVLKNLVDDRYGVAYKGWVTLDLESGKNAQGEYPVKVYRQQQQNFPLDLKLLNSSIKGIADDDYRARLVKDLEQGKRVPVTMVIGGKDTEAFIQAVGKKNDISLHDDQRRPIVGSIAASKKSSVTVILNKAAANRSEDAPVKSQKSAYRLH